MGWLLIILLMVMVFGSVPVSFALTLTGLIFFLVHNIPLESFAQRMVEGVDSFPLLAAPFFILAGNLMNAGGITRRIFNLADSLVGHIRGGLGHVNVLASMLFAGMSGSALADAAGLGKVQIEAMTDRGYDIEFSTAVTAGSATIGPIIPPSIIMVIYGISAQVSIGNLFLGGIIPGVLMGLSLMLMVYFYSLINKYAVNDGFKLSRVWHILKECILALFTPIIIVGGILGGIFTPTESGAIAALYAFVISFFVYKEVSLKQFGKILMETASVTAVVLFIVTSASIYGWTLTFEQIPQAIALQLVSVSTEPLIILLILSVLYLFLGALMEPSAIVIMTIPIVLPILNQFGIDPVFFGVLLAINMSVGTITPPVGITMFVLCKITGQSIDQYAKFIWPWLLLLILFMVLLMVFPEIVLFIPNLAN